MENRRSIKFVTPDKDVFFLTVRKRVNEYFKNKGHSIKANREMVIKSASLLIAYFLSLAFIFIVNPPFWIALLGWAIAGIALAGIGMSVMHDANHGAYSENKTINIIMGHTLNLIGGSVFNWKLQHNLLHHTYTNISGMDDDIQDRAALRLSPHSQIKGFHRLQWFYATFFYGLMTLYWVLAKDIIQYYKYKKDGTLKNEKQKNAGTILLILSNKLIYLFVMIGLPVLFFHLSFFQVLVGFLMMHFFSGVILAYVFQLAHSVEGTSHPLPDENGVIENAWAVHQMNTTVNFSPGNRVISWYVGGLNYQIEHHLFPKICHVHYPKIAGIVKETAAEFNIPYMENKSFSKALQSHFIILKNLGKLPKLSEIMA
jgi:linoleoyl-CoA desaturase